MFPYLGAGLGVNVLPKDRVVFLMEADGARDLERLAPRVGHHGVDVDDLPEAVAAELKRSGHVTETPLADVKRGSPIVVESRVPVGHHHLGERHPVRDVPPGSLIVESNLIDHRTLAEVETQPQRPVLPPHLIAIDSKGDPPPAG